MRITSPKSCGRNCAAASERAPMISPSTPCIERRRARRAVASVLTLFVCLALSLSSARADAVGSANAAYARGDYIGAVKILTPLALHGNARAQAFLGLMYDKGHGVPQDFVLAYKWLNLAASRAPRHDRDYFLRLRNAVASKMSRAQIAEGQYLALCWAPGLP